MDTILKFLFRGSTSLFLIGLMTIGLSTSLAKYSADKSATDNLFTLAKHSVARAGADNLFGLAKNSIVRASVDNLFTLAKYSFSPAATDNLFTLAKYSVVQSATDKPFSLAWTSEEFEDSASVAWGDYDGDGDLDLAVGGAASYRYGFPIRLYRNDGGVLTASAVWSSSNDGNGNIIAWGDYDGDGDLDLAAAASNDWSHHGPIRLYHNDGGVLTTDPAWKSEDIPYTTSIAWGDYDGDGKLDLAVGINGQPNRLYHNDGGVLSLSTWVPNVSDNTTTLAWGDYDKDGHLDLAVGNNGQPNRIYRNVGGVLSQSATWSADVSFNTTSIAWGDYDGDGYLDLAVGNNGQPNQIYHNAGGVLTLSVWVPNVSDNTTSIAWGDIDGDGDLDLVVGNNGQPNRVYLNDGGVLSQSPTWSADEILNTTSIALGDFDGNGSLDLAVANSFQVYVNAFQPRILYRNNNRGLLRPKAAWSSAESGTTQSVARGGVAWGDYNWDGNLDLAVGNYGAPNRIYRNDGGVLSQIASWSADVSSNTTSIAWGDYDGDGRLDLAVGNDGQPNRIYHNDGGVMTTSPVWESSSSGLVAKIAWVDYDGDGNLDLAVGGDRESCIYNNDGGGISTSCSVVLPTCYSSINAWGDYDKDGDLDLAVGCYGYRYTGYPNHIYRNDGGTFTLVWTSTEQAFTTNLAWGDYDGDGDLDLAVGNYGQPSRIYRNDGGILTTNAVWASNECDYTTSIAWGDVDGDGDLDLAVGNNGQPNRIYRNDGGVLSKSAAWSAGEIFNTTSIAWGDVNNDGRLELAVVNNGQPNMVYLNGGGSTLGQMPTIQVLRPKPPENADFYSSPIIWADRYISIPYKLSGPTGSRVKSIRAFYSLDGGGNWREATASSGTITTNLTTNTDHIYDWDVFSSGFYGQSDNVVFRIIAIPAIVNYPNSIPGPYLSGSSASQTFPFRVRGTQVRVFEDGSPVSNAAVYRSAGGNSPFTIISDPSEQPYFTDNQGYLQGRGELDKGDQLVALLPKKITDTYTIYHTSARPSESGLDASEITKYGVKDLTVSQSYPLALFNLNVSLEWDATNDPQFITQLRHDLQRASELLYDWTNGQAALGKVNVYQDRDHWNDAHIRIYASNRLRPNAAMGGVVSQKTHDPGQNLSNIIYEPGQVSMGSIWNRYGEASGSLGEDWPRGLAHELGHYLFYLDDDYLGLNGGTLIPVEGCPSAMSDPYRDDYSEFHAQTNWSSECAQTLAQNSTGRSDWETVSTFYPALNSSPANAGPVSLPLAVTDVQIIPPSSTVTPLPNPIFFLTNANGARIQPGPTAQAFLFQGDHLIDLGVPTQGEILARGARSGDRLCVFEPAAHRAGCWSLSQGNVPLKLTDLPNWQPTVLVDAQNSSTFTITVKGAPSGLPLLARVYSPNVYSPNDPAPSAISLTGANGVYSGTFNLLSPIPEGIVRIYIDEGDPRQIITNYTLGGNPARSWARWARSWARFVPASSSDGQLILFGNNLNFPEGEFYGVQALTLANDATPSWMTVVGRAYRLFTSARAPSLSSSSVAFGYLGSEVPPLEEQWLTVYYSSNGTSWNNLDTNLDMEHNIASAPAQGPGFYALLTAFEIPLYGPGWNMVSYPVPNPDDNSHPVSETLLSIAGSYTVVYGYDSYDTADPWKVYGISAPTYVNDLKELKFGGGYWIYATKDITLRLKGPAVGTTGTNSSPSFGLPPSTFYGPVSGGQAFTPTPGLLVTAWIDGHPCGQGRTLPDNGQVVYTIDVFSDDPENTLGCGAPGKKVEFHIGSYLVPTTAGWDNIHVQYLPFGSTYQLLNVNKTGTGSGTVTSNPAGINCSPICSYSFNYNTVVTLTATAVSGSTFAGWSDATCSGTGTCTLTMNADKTVNVGFSSSPVLVTPGDGITLANKLPMFDWLDVQGATIYDVQVARNNTFKTGLKTYKVYSSVYQVPKDWPANTTYFWRVRAYGLFGMTGFSEVRSFTTANPPSAPKLLLPKNNTLTTNYRPRLDWSNSSLPKGTTFQKYELQLAKDSAFTDPASVDVVILGTASYLEYDPETGLYINTTVSEYIPDTDLDPNTKYYWRVRAFNTLNQYSAWSSVRTFRTAILPPTLSSPGNGSSTKNRRPVFDWSDVDGASGYILQVSTSSAFKSSVIKVKVTSSTYSPGKDLPVGTLYWRVMAKGSNGPSVWSEIRTLIEN